MNILGLYGAFDWDGNKQLHPIKPNYKTWCHDSGASLFKDGKHICSINEERLTRIKYDGNYPIQSIKYCLLEGGITGDDIDIVCVPTQCIHIFYDQLESKVIDNILLSMFPNAQIKIISHHVCHAASSVFTSNFSEGSIVTLDGAGTTVLGFDRQEANLENNTVGYFNKKERTFNMFVGGKEFNRFGDYYGLYSFDIYCRKSNIPEHKRIEINRESTDGKVMGLSAYGNVGILDHYKKSDETWGGVPFVLFNLVEKNLNGSEEDVAATMQKTFEDALMFYINSLKTNGYLKENICFSGGVFLNVLANTEIKRIVNNMHIPPYTNDTGLAFGAAAYTAFKLGYDIEMPDNIAFLGKLYSDSKIQNALQTYNLKYDVYDPKDVAVHLMDNKIIAWFQNRSEAGPRALGARSILMSAKHKDNKDILNSRVKHREYWRPFAGIILDHKLSEYFDDSFETPYMLYSLIVKEEKREEIPAITHKDNSCRIQTVNNTYNKEVTKLIEEYYKLSGTPVILNTSFNDNGEPIVETPEHAIEAFLNMDIDYLVIGNYIVNKKDIK